MKKITIILILVAVLSAYPVFNIVGLARDSVVPDDTDLSEGANIMETLVGFDVKKAQKNVTSAEKKRNERLEGYKSVNQILKNLDSEKYDIHTIELPKDKRDTAWVSQLMALHPDFVLSALHGGRGENGAVQGLLQCLDIPQFFDLHFQYKMLE